MRGQSVRRPQRLELLHEVARRHHVGTARAHQFNGAGVDARHVRDGGKRRVFHRHRPASVEDAPQAGLEFDATRVLDGVAGQVGQRATLDLVDQGTGITSDRDQVEPPARGHVPGRRQTGDPAGHRVGSVEVVEQPPVEMGRAEGRLDGGYVD